MSGASGLATAPAEARRLRLVGLVYLLVVAGLVALSVAFYRHAFSDDVTVVVRARSAGQQLNVGGDVRMNGAIVGRVSSVDRSDDGVSVELQVDRDAAGRIPDDVTARILPTTLFGQKFVELRSSTRVAGAGLREGAVVPEDTSTEAVELTEVLDDLDRVLRSVRPDRLALTLGALSEGVDGRGAQIARTIDRAGSYLATLNQDAPLLARDVRLLADVSHAYADAAPDLLAVLRQGTTISQTLTAEPGTWGGFVAALDDLATSGTTLLEANGRQIAETAHLARPTLELLRDYAPQLTCTIEGFLAVERSSAAQIRDHAFQGHFTMGAQAGGYTDDDALKLGDLGAGPGCQGLPDAPIPYGPVDLDTGVEDASLTEILGLPGAGR